MTTVVRPPRISSLHVFCAVLVVAILPRPLIISAMSAAAVRTAATVFVAVCV